MIWIWFLCIYCILLYIKKQLITNYFATTGFRAIPLWPMTSAEEFYGKGQSYALFAGQELGREALQNITNLYVWMMVVSTWNFSARVWQSCDCFVLCPLASAYSNPLRLLFEDRGKKPNFSRLVWKTKPNVGGFQSFQECFSSTLK